MTEVETPTAGVRNGATALGVAGVAFVAYPASRPYVDGPSVWVAPLWIPSHLLGVLAFALLVPGLAALWSAHRGTPGERAAWSGLLTAGAGVALVLPYYGAESFALAELGRPGTGVPPATVDALAEGIRMGPYAVTTFAAGLAALAVAGVAVAVALRRGGVLPPAAGLVFAIGLVLYLPQFFAPPALRIAHGALLAAGCLLLAVVLHRAAAGRDAVLPSRG
ncbi:hypothetical protein WIS52_28975 [Pseudonocardia nematodicida]|uniref:Uncharacterized protein n=1 Tax=Pseudonocardia nematodicida TaxID=1206997 RepID=A0ABV1KJ90_9PSEU